MKPHDKTKNKMELKTQIHTSFEEIGLAKVPISPLKSTCKQE